MKGEIFQPDQPILADDLQLAQSSKEDAIKERQSDYFAEGVLENSQFFPLDADETRAINIVPGSNNIAGNPTITVRTGIAYSPLGERIAIPTVETFESAVVGVSTVVSGNPVLPDGSINGPLTKTDNGIGGYTLTPRSSGSENIPLIQSATNYIWLGYLKTTNPAVFTLSNTTSERLFVTATDGYEIRVTTANINPDSDRFFLLGSVVVTNIVLSANISFTNRVYSRTNAHRVGIKVNPVRKPSSYTSTAAVLTGTVTAASFSVNTKTLIVAVDGGSDQTATFTGVDPIAISTIVSQINSQVVGVVAEAVGNQIKLTADDQLIIKNGTANADFGFTNNQTALGSFVALDDHINSVGSGVVSSSNPHALTAADLGIINLEDVGRKLSSSGLIVPDGDTNSSALYPIAVSSGTPEDNVVTFKALLSTESVNVSGVIVTSSDLGSDKSFKFVDNSNVPIANGLYTFYVNRSTKQIERSLPNEVITDPDKFILAQITWAAPSLTLPITDKRYFGTTSASNIRYELMGGIWGLATGNRGYTYSYDVDNRVTQIVIAGDHSSIGGVDTTVTFTYDIPGPNGKVVQVEAAMGNRTMITTISYTGDLVTSVTESIS